MEFIDRKLSRFIELISILACFMISVYVPLNIAVDCGTFQAF